jgi:hypothetical protein
MKATSIEKVKVTSIDAAITAAKVQKQASELKTLNATMNATGSTMGKLLIAVQTGLKNHVVQGGTFYSKWLKREGISRTSAFYAIKKAQGVDRAKEKPQTAESRTQSAVRTLFTEHKVAEFDSTKFGKMGSLLSDILNEIYPDTFLLVTVSQKMPVSAQ